MKLAVANMGGNDSSIDYRDSGAMEPGFEGHAPINYHAYAAATKGKFVSTLADLEGMDRGETVVCLLLTRKLKSCLQSLRAIRKEGFSVHVAWKECGSFQVQRVLDSSSNLELYREIVDAADGILYTSLDPPLFGERGARRLLTPYPLDLDEWDRSVDLSGREGIFLGTREWFVPGRCHGQGLALALEVARRSDTFVTVINRDGKRGAKLYRSAFGKELSTGHLRLVEGRQPYLDYLGLMARHRLVLQWDRSGVPGQVAGDALLCRSLCLGGNSAIEKEAFGHFLDLEVAFEHAEKLLADDSFYEAQIRDSRERALERLSFGAFRKRVSALFP